MQNARLKLDSGPFDWIFSSLDMVNHCISDDFSEFLNQRNFTPVPEERRPSPHVAFCHHQLYLDLYGVGFTFNHSDPRNPAVYEYLKRCVARFQAAITSEQPTLLLGILERPWTSKPAFRRLADLLNDYPHTDAVAIAIGPERGRRVLRLVETIGRHRLFVFNPTSSVSGIQFSDPADNDYLRLEIKELAAVEAISAHSAASNVSAA